MAQTQIYAGKAQVHMIPETAAGDTYIAPAGDGSGIFLAADVTMSYDSSNYSPNYVREDYLSHDEIPGPMSGSISFSVPLKGSGTAGTAPEFAVALLGCGMRQSLTAITSANYYPISLFDAATAAGPPATTNPDQSYSVSILQNAVRHAIKGAFGNVSISANVDDIGMLNFTFTGAYVAFADDGLDVTPVSYDTTTPPAFRGATFVAHTYAAKGVNTLSLDLGNKISIMKDANNAAGILGARIVGRKSTGSFDCELTLAATNNYISRQRAGTSGSITTGAIGATAGNKWTLTVARSVLQPIAVSDRDGIAIQTVPFAVSSNYTDVEGTTPDITLSFT